MSPRPRASDDLRSGATPALHGVMRAAGLLALLALAACGGENYAGNGYCPPNSIIDSTGNCVAKPPRGY